MQIQKLIQMNTRIAQEDSLVSFSWFRGPREIIWRQFLQQFGKVNAGKWLLTKLGGTANDKRMSHHGVSPFRQIGP